jgi:hypothetical protein
MEMLSPRAGGVNAALGRAFLPDIRIGDSINARTDSTP